MANDHTADTEWNDILREKGIIGPKEPDIYETELDTRVEIYNQAKAQEVDPANKDLDEIDLLLQDDMDDDRILESYRAKRLEEIRAATSKMIFGSVYPISKPDFIREVTESSKIQPVIVNLFKDYLPESKLLSSLIERLASKYRATKFTKIVGDQCIPNYPDKNLPTLLIYIEGDLATQLVTLSSLGGMNTTEKRLEKYLSSIGAIQFQKSDDGSDEDEKDDEPLRTSIFSQINHLEVDDDN